MKKYNIDVALLRTKESAYEHLANVFNFPSYFGKNLDALHECLHDLTDTEGTIAIVWKNDIPSNESQIFQSIRSIMTDNKRIIFVD